MLGIKSMLPIRTQQVFPLEVDTSQSTTQVLGRITASLTDGVSNLFMLHRLYSNRPQNHRPVGECEENWDLLVQLISTTQVIEGHSGHALDLVLKATKPRACTVRAHAGVLPDSRTSHRGPG
jgi:hypothetical protein